VLHVPALIVLLATGAVALTQPQADWPTQVLPIMFLVLLGCLILDVFFLLLSLFRN